MINQIGFDFITQNSIKLYEFLQQNKIKKKQVYLVLQKGNTKFLSEQLKKSEQKKAVEDLKNYTKRTCFEDFFWQNENKFPHLKEIYDIVNMDSMINQVITNPIFEKKRNLYYADFMIDSLIEEFYDYQSVQFLAKVKQEIIEKKKKLNRLIEKNIRYFYIRRITI